MKRQTTTVLFKMWKGFPGVSGVKNLPVMQEKRVQSLGWEDPPKKEIATHCNIFAWEIPWTENLRWLQPMGSQRSRT